MGLFVENWEKGRWGEEVDVVRLERCDKWQITKLEECGKQNTLILNSN